MKKNIKPHFILGLLIAGLLTFSCRNKEQSADRDAPPTDYSKQNTIEDGPTGEDNDRTATEQYDKNETKTEEGGRTVTDDDPGSVQERNSDR